MLYARRSVYIVDGRPLYSDYTHASVRIVGDCRQYARHNI